jgi:hypothetical protein
MGWIRNHKSIRETARAQWDRLRCEQRSVSCSYELGAPTADVGDERRVADVGRGRNASKGERRLLQTVNRADIDPCLVSRSLEKLGAIAAARVASVATATMRVAPSSRAWVAKRTRVATAESIRSSSSRPVLSRFCPRRTTSDAQSI